MPKPPRPKPPTPAPKMSAPPPTTRTQSNKTFTLAPWTGEGEGQKILLYGSTGMGKTSLCTMLPDPAWIGVDDGGRRIKHVKTGCNIMRCPEISCFEDIRAALQSSVFDGVKTIVLDTITDAQEWALGSTFRRIKAGKGQIATNVEDYGYHKGYRYWYDTMDLLKPDLDSHIRAGRNVVLVAQNAQVKQNNASGEDYFKDGPDLMNERNCSIYASFTKWADHILRIGYAHMQVEDKKASGSTTRAIYLQPDVTWEAKVRGVSSEYDVVTFSEPSDDSIWRLIFG